MLFLQNWHFENNWILPPVSQIARVIAHLKLNISAAREQQAVGLGLFNVVASWVKEFE